MKLYKKEGNTLHIISFPNESISKGDYLIIEEPKDTKALLAQVIDVQFANVPGILEELLRECTNDYGDFIRGEDIDPLEVESQINLIQDARILICKIRATLNEGKLCSPSSWLPSRSQSQIKKLPIKMLFSLAQMNGNYPIFLGETEENSQVIVDAQSLDGKLNIITGKKETGKSHLSKLLVVSLIHYGATVVVLDLNGEYSALGFTHDGKKNDYYTKIHVLAPAKNFKVTLKQLNLRVMLNILLNALHLPGTSAREFRRIWQSLKERNALSLQELGETIRNWRCNQHVRDALFSRYYALLNSGFFTDNEDETTQIENIFKKTSINGGAVIIDLSDMSSIDRQIVVEYTLGKLVDMLCNWQLKAVFLFAEEAHLYLRETYWDDIVTRMRHFGVFTTFVTNQPDSIKESIYRQADNIFLFNFTNEHDLETVSRAAKVDAETVKSVARDLSPRYCLALGKVVGEFPVVVKVRALEVQAKGQTRLFFTGKN